MFDVSPSTFSENDFNACISAHIVAVEGLGLRLAREPEENGWNQSSLYDHDIGLIILDDAILNLKSFARANQIYYNNTKLEDAAKQALIAAYGNAFIMEANRG